jgi:hypothetical protein
MIWNCIKLVKNLFASRVENFLTRDVLKEPPVMLIKNENFGADLSS